MVQYQLFIKLLKKYTMNLSSDPVFLVSAHWLSLGKILQRSTVLNRFANSK